MTLFEPQETPRVFAVPMGVDFPRALAQGLIQRSRALPPEDLARVEVILNTSRMMRRCRSLFEEGPALLLPRMRLLTDLAQEASLQGLPLPCHRCAAGWSCRNSSPSCWMRSRIWRHVPRFMISPTVSPIWWMKCKAKVSAPR